MEGTEIISGLKLGNPSFLRERETNQKDRNAVPRQRGSVKMEEIRQGQSLQNSETLSRQEDLNLKGLMERCLKATIVEY